MRKLSVNNSQGVRKIRKERLLQNTQSIRRHFSKILYRWLIYEHLTNPESKIPSIRISERVFTKND